jgi:hypothetical protein
MCLILNDANSVKNLNSALEEPVMTLFLMPNPAECVELVTSPTDPFPQLTVAR